MNGAVTRSPTCQPRRRRPRRRARRSRRRTRGRARAAARRCRRGPSRRASRCGRRPVARTRITAPRGGHAGSGTSTSSGLLAEGVHEHGAHRGPPFGVDGCRGGSAFAVGRGRMPRGGASVAAASPATSASLPPRDADVRHGAAGLCNNMGCDSCSPCSLAAVCFGTTGTAQALGPDASAASVGAARILIGGGALGLVALALHLAGRRRGATGTSAAPTPGAATRHPLPSWCSSCIGAARRARLPARVLRRHRGERRRRRHRRRARLRAGHHGCARLGAAPAVPRPPVARRDGDRHRRASRSSPRRPTPGTRAADPLGLLASLGAGASYAVYTLAAKALLDRGLDPDRQHGRAVRRSRRS